MPETKNSTVTIRGQNDDGILVSGHIAAHFVPYGGRGFLHFEGGTVVEARLHSPTGIWLISGVALGEGATWKALEPEMYSEVLEITGPFGRVRCYGSADGPTEADAQDFFDSGVEASEYSPAQLLTAMKALEEVGCCPERDAEPRYYKPDHASERREDQILAEMRDIAMIAKAKSEVDKVLAERGQGTAAEEGAER